MAMMGDAISHSVLPGIAIAYLLSNSRDSWVMLLGATAFGILTTLLIEQVHQRMRVQEDASIGLVFTAFFSIGVIIISAYAENIDLDQECVLYGEMVHLPLQSLYWGKQAIGPMAMYNAVVMLLLVLTAIVLAFRRLQVCTFDPGFAVSLGISVSVWHYLLMSLVSFTTVVSFEAVGAILVVAFLVVPSSAAFLLTQRLSHMLVLAALIALFSAVGGYYLAYWLDASIAGCMTCVAGLFFLVAFLSQRLLNKTIPLTKENTGTKAIGIN
jgi:manganese/zinc/iron transport system permease protein